MSITAGISMFMRGNWKWVAPTALGLAGCATLGTMLVFEKIDHVATSKDLVRTEAELNASEQQYQAAERGRTTLKTALGRVQSSLEEAQKQSRESQALVDVALQRGSGRLSELQSELDRLRSQAPVSPELDCPTAMELAEEAWLQ